MTSLGFLSSPPPLPSSPLSKSRPPFSSLRLRASSSSPSSSPTPVPELKVVVTRERGKNAKLMGALVLLVLLVVTDYTLASGFSSYYLLLICLNFGSIIGRSNGVSLLHFILGLLCFCFLFSLKNIRIWNWNWNGSLFELNWCCSTKRNCIPPFYQMLSPFFCILVYLC